MTTLEKALDSAHNTIVFGVRDWGMNRRDAWLWGIFVGWDDAAMTEVSSRHGWGPEVVSRLRGLRAAIIDAGGPAT